MKLREVQLLTIFLIALQYSAAAPPPTNTILANTTVIQGNELSLPYQVILKIFDLFICSGTIIHDRWVLTAAHCVHKLPTNVVTITAGSIDLNSGGTTVGARKFIVHEDFVALPVKSLRNDIALIELNEPLNFTSSSIRPIKIFNGIVPLGSKVDVSGWSRLVQNVTIAAQVLFKSKLVVTECPAEYGEFVRRDSYCLAHSVGNGACEGDSGGPATYKNQLIGIGSRVSYPCGSIMPNVHTKVYAFIDWIRKHTGDNSI